MALKLETLIRDRLIKVSSFTFYVMVEAVGVEPTSENISTRASPSAVSILTFPPPSPY